MSSPVLVLVLRSADGRTLLPLRAGLLVGESPEGAPVLDVGDLEQLNWHWDRDAKVMAAALVTHQTRSTREARPTRLTAGQRREDGLEIMGDLAQLVEIVRRVKQADSGQTRSRDESPDPPVDAETPTTGMAALLASLVVLTPEGLGRLGAIVTSGGKPRSEFDRDGQDGKVPAGIPTGARVASWRDEGTDKGWSMPIRYGLLDGTEASDPEGDAPERQQTGVGGGDTAESNGLGAGTFRRDNGPPTRIVQILPGGAERVIREAPPGRSGDAFAPAQHLILNDLAIQQRRILDLLVPMQRARDEAFAAGKDLDAAQATRLRVLESELARFNRNFTALGADPGKLDIASAGGRGAGGGGAVPGSTQHPAAEDITAHPGDPDALEWWGKLDAYDEETETWLDERERGRDPEKYRDRARWAPHGYVSLDKIMDPPRKPPPPEPPPPPPPPPEPPPPPPGGDPQVRTPFVPEGTQTRDKRMISLPKTALPVGDLHEGIARIDGESEDDVDHGWTQGVQLPWSSDPPFAPPGGTTHGPDSPLGPIPTGGGESSTPTGFDPGGLATPLDPTGLGTGTDAPGSTTRGPPAQCPIGTTTRRRGPTWGWAGLLDGSGGFRA